MKRIFSTLVILAVSTSVITGLAQEERPQTPFAYPVAPDTCSTLESRCDYILQHFWENFDISKPIANDADLLIAFRDYADFLQYAHRNVVMTSVGNLLNKAQSNTTNLMKLGRAAELCLYAPGAPYWSDEVYVEFAKALATNKTLDKDVRNYFGNQLARINACQEQKPLPDIEMTDAEGKKLNLSGIEGDMMVLFFYDDGIDSSIGRTRLAADAGMNALIEQGSVKLVSVYLGKHQTGFADSMPDNWFNTCSERAGQIYDIRALPCCYMVGENKILITKNLSVDELKDAVN